MKLSARQLRQIGASVFRGKLSSAMRRSLPEFDALSAESRTAFLDACQEGAAACGLVTEQGVASYCLAAWFLEPGFEKKSRYLQALLDSAFPEVRKVYAMNEWAHVLIGNPSDMAAADAALKQAFYGTAAWGQA